MCGLQVAMTWIIIKSDPIHCFCIITTHSDMAGCLNERKCHADIKPERVCKLSMHAKEDKISASKFYEYKNFESEPIEWMQIITIEWRTRDETKTYKTITIQRKAHKKK